jgi:mono/diheme cytochrome c family protein
MRQLLIGALLAPFILSSFVLAISPSRDEEVLAKGKRIWLSACIQCHHRDPNLKGPVGPEVTDSPLEVMTSKIMTGKYPDPLPQGFVPKRTSRAMRPLPKYKDDIFAIWSYVQSEKKSNP